VKLTLQTAALGWLALFTALLPPATADDAYLGVAVHPASPTLQQQLELPPALGLLVHHVAPGSPADRAGIRPHDILLQLNGQLLIVPDQLEGLLRGLPTDTPVPLELMRARERLILDLTLTTRPSPASESSPLRVTVIRTSTLVPAPALADLIQATAQTQPPLPTEAAPLPVYLGLHLAAVSPALLAHLTPEVTGGAVILAIAPASPADAASLQPHDVIVRVNDRPILHPDELFAVMRNLRPASQLQLTVVRQGQPRDLSATLAAPPPEAPTGFDLTAESERLPLPPLPFATDAEWLVVVKPLPVGALPPPESPTLSEPATLVIDDADLIIRLEGDPLQRQATITDVHGSILYRGGITTPADRLQMPSYLWARVATLIDPANLSPRATPQLESDQLWEWRPPPDWL
jgi:membrane-associated protease RseP (regulator of RpoE activity)